jgi:tungstate transport system substrate-binding protein
MVMTGMWQRLSEQFEHDTGYKIELAAVGPKEIIAPAFRKGNIDLLTMHSSDEATALVAEGFAINMRPWTWNEQVIVGPVDDPAGIRGMKDGGAALKKIAETHSTFVDALGGGKRLVAEKLWEKAGIRPSGAWLIKDESTSPTDLLNFAEKRHAYAICGRAPILWSKIQKGKGMEIMVEGDPAMKRPFVVIEANSKQFPETNAKGAKILSDYLVGERGQAFLSSFKPDQTGMLPVFYPLSSEN